jgi:hypothetical protein
MNMSDQRITQLPWPGNAGRAPTGAMQFQDDWPGLFIRGDDAIALLGDLRRLEKLLRDSHETGLPHKLSQVVEIIERDVIVRHA